MRVHLLRRLLPRAVALVVALAGVTLLVAAGLLATVFSPEPTRSGRLSAPPATPVVVTRPGMLTLLGPRVTVQARGQSGEQVFLGVARAADAEAYLAGAGRQQVSGLDAQNRLILQPRPGEATLPDPAGVDIWVTAARGSGTAALTWPQRPGDWALVVASDGSRPAPSTLSMIWTTAERRSAVPGLAAGGMLLMVGGLVGFSVLQSRAGTPAPPAQDRSRPAPTRESV